MPIAFKEWAVTVRALAEGEQLLTLRKGGIREEDQPLRARARPLLPLPDVRPPAQRPRARVAPAGARSAPSRRASGPTASRPPHALTPDGGIAQPDRVRIRAWAEVAGQLPDHRPRAASTRCRPYYVWTTDYAEKRLAWKRRHPLHVILLRTYRIPRPVTVKVRDEYGGCRSWLELHRELPFEGTPVLSDDEFERAAAEIEANRPRPGIPVLV